MNQVTDRQSRQTRARRNSRQRTVSSLAIISLASATLGCGPEDRPTPVKLDGKPNVLIVIADDQGWGDFAANGNDVLATPALDGLAEAGARFNRFYVSPVCSSTRASLLTGRHFLRTGVWSVTRGGEKMRSEEITIAELFREAGYRTGYFGKWHNGAQYPYTPRAQGFDEFIGFVGGHLSSYFDVTLTDNGQPLNTFGFVPDVLTELAIEFMSKTDAQPFLAMLAFNTPHSPFELPEDDFLRYRNQGLAAVDSAIYGLTENLDRNVGRLLQALQQKGLRERTIVVFLSDNGPAFPGGAARFNGDLRGHKGRVTEGGIRVPLFVAWPGRIPAGSSVDGLAQHIDVLPTIAALAGLDVPATLQVDGRSLVPLIDGASNPERMLFTSHFHNTRRPSEVAVRPYPAAVHYRNWAAVREDDGAWGLYDLAADPAQRRSLAGENPALLTKLSGAYEAYFAEVTRAGFSSLVPEIGHARSTELRLPAHEASIHGDAFDYAHHWGWAEDWVTTTGRAEGRIEWSIRIAEQGRYAVSVEYAAADSDVSLSITIDSATAAASIELERHIAEPRPVRRVHETGEAHPMSWAESRPVRFDLEPGTYRLAIGTPERQAQGKLLIKSLRIAWDPA